MQIRSGSILYMQYRGRIPTARLKTWIQVKNVCQKLYDISFGPKLQSVTFVKH